MTRLDPNIFEIPITDIRMGYRSAVYFSRTQGIMQAEKPTDVVTMQVFQKTDAVLCGIDEAIGILKTCAGHYRDYNEARGIFTLLLNMRRQARAVRPGQWKPGGHQIVAQIKGDSAYKTNLVEIARLEQVLENMWVPAWEALEVSALADGDSIAPWESVLTITGPYSQFAHLESVYLGVLARQTRIASNTRRVVDELNGKPLLFFADRFDHYATQGGDGYAAQVAGASGFASDAMTSWWGARGVGTMPHALIAAYGGDVVAASAAFHKHYPDTDLIALVDFNNNCVGDSLQCLRQFGDDLFAVRLDTSETLVDASISDRQMGEIRPTGVNPILVHNVRAALDANGGKHVKIVVSGGFTWQKIREFELAAVPVDIYAVGSSLLGGSSTDFTADIVAPAAKTGRWARRNRRLEIVR